MNKYTYGINETKAVQDIENDLRKYNIVSDDILCGRILADETILNYTLEHGCGKFSYLCRRKSGKVILTMKFPCDEFNIFEDDNELIISNVLKNIPLEYGWKYKNGANIVEFRFEAARSHINNILYVYKFIENVRGRFTVAAVMQVVSMLLSILLPFLSARIIESFVVSDFRKIVMVSVILLLSYTLNNLLVSFFNRIYNRMYNSVMNSVEADISREIMEMDINCIEKHDSGMFIQRMTTDTNWIAEGFDVVLTNFCEFVKFSGILFAVFIVSPALFAVKIAGFVILVFIEFKRSERVHSERRTYLMFDDRFVGLTGEMVHGSREIKLLNCAGAFMAKMRESLENMNGARLKYLDSGWRFAFLRNVAGEFLEVIFYLFLAAFCMKGMITPTIAVVLINYSLSLSEMPVFFGNLVENLKCVSLSSERIYQFVNSREFTKETFGTLCPGQVDGNIEFCNVSFSYDRDTIFRRKKFVLKNMNFRINAGETVAFVGKSGCGKSTAIGLIAKLFDASEGAVLIDGTDIQKLSRDTIRKNISAISQTPYFFNMSVRDNFRLIKEDITDEEIKEACKKACIYDEINAMQDGFDTVLGEGGSGISGGQRQRLAIARSLVYGSKIMMFDEATSALDNITQSQIQEVIKSLHDEKTIVIVAHRFSTVIGCDRIFMFSDGKIIASGTHKQLLESCSEYRELYGMELMPAGGKNE